MYLRRLIVRNTKLLHELELTFDDASGSDPRMWTVFVGENGLCKTTLLRAIAMAAMGPEISTKLADVPSLPDKRQDDELWIHADFSFSDELHEARHYPPGMQFARPPFVTSDIKAKPGHSIVSGKSGYSEGRPLQSTYGPEGSPADGFLHPLSEARSSGLPLWFVAGYGVGRILRSPASAADTPDQSADRVASLFRHDQLVLGTKFADLFAEPRARAFARTLRDIFVDTELLPGVTNVELKGKGGVRTAAHLVESHRFELKVGQELLRVPATWLSQGYQSVISLVADFVGHIWLEADAEVPPREMEGIVLIDEIDLHLHPKWQASLVRSLRTAFPRIQFIATTHSPMVLPGLEQDEVFILRQDPTTGDVTADPATQAPRMMTGSELYGAFFDLDRRFAADVGSRLARYAYLATNAQRSEAEEQEAQRLLAQLRAEDVPVDVVPVPRMAPRRGA